MLSLVGVVSEYSKMLGDIKPRILRALSYHPEFLGAFNDPKNLDFDVKDAKKYQQLSRAVDDIALRVEMRTSAEFLGTLGEYGASYSASGGGLFGAINSNISEVYERAFGLHKNHEKAAAYTREFAGMLHEVANRNKDSGIGISTLSGQKSIYSLVEGQFTDSLRTSNAVLNLPSAKSPTRLADTVISANILREAGDEVSKAIATISQAPPGVFSDDVLAAASEQAAKTTGMRTSMAKRTLDGVLQAGETAAKVMRARF